MNKSEIKKAESQRNEIQENMNEKRYLCKLLIIGDETMSLGDSSKQIHAKREWAFVSTNEISRLLSKTGQSFYEICDYSGEKKWGRYYDIEIFPLTKELEDEYLYMSESNFIKGYREFYERNPEHISEVA